jgi:hypothetical protein
MSYLRTLVATLPFGIVLAGCQFLLAAEADPSEQSGTGIELTLSAPEPTADFKVGIDGGIYGSQPRVRMVRADGSTSVTVNLDLPEGGPYRIRAVARRAGEGSARETAGWASGKTTGVMVEEGTTSEVSVELEPYSVSISAPIQVTRGQIVTVRWSYNDPGDVLEDGNRFGEPGGALRIRNLPFPDGSTDANRIEASGERVGEGEYEMSATFTANPSDPETVYLQVEALTFGTFVDTAPIHLVDPSRRRGEELRTISVN